MEGRPRTGMIDRWASTRANEHGRERERSHHQTSFHVNRCASRRGLGPLSLLEVYNCYIDYPPPARNPPHPTAPTCLPVVCELVLCVSWCCV